MKKTEILSKNFVITAKALFGHELKIFNGIAYPLKDLYEGESDEMFSKLHNAIYAAILAPNAEYNADTHYTEDYKKQNKISNWHTLSDFLSPVELRLYTIALCRCSKAIAAARSRIDVNFDYFLDICNHFASIVKQSNPSLVARGDLNRELMNTSNPFETKAILKNREIVTRALDERLIGKKYVLKSGANFKKNLANQYMDAFKRLRNMLVYFGVSDKESRRQIMQSIDCGLFETSYFLKTKDNFFRLVQDDISLSYDDYVINTQKLNDAYDVLFEAFEKKPNIQLCDLKRLAFQSGENTRYLLAKQNTAPEFYASFVYLLHEKNISPFNKKYKKASD